MADGLRSVRSLRASLDAYVAGSTWSTDFPTTGDAFQPGDAFLTKFEW